jgi:diguanylate cyclase (GGDEF)-like protein/PAS domain S-box-containing protein
MLIILKGQGMLKPRARSAFFNIIIGILMAVVFAGAVLSSIVYVLSVRNEYISKTREALSDKGNAAAAFIDPAELKELDGSEATGDSAAYHAMENRLNRLIAVSGKARYAYILLPLEDEILTLCASDESTAGQYGQQDGIRPVVKQAIFDSMAQNQGSIIGPEEDPDGKFVTTLSPVIDPRTGRAIAVLGINYSKQFYDTEVDSHMLEAIMMAASVLVVLTCLYWFIYQNRRLANLTRKSQTQEKLFRTIFEQTPIGIGMMNNFNILSSVNQTYLNIFGRSEEELRELSWADLTHPADLGEDLRQFELLQKGEIEDYSMEKRFIRPDGSIVWVNMIVIRFRLEGHRENTHLCILQDISNRKAAELALGEAERSKSVLLSHLPGMAYRCRNDEFWTIEFASEGSLELTGYAPEDLIENRVVSYNDLVVPQYRDLLRKEWSRVLARREPFKAEYEIVRRDGERKWILELGQGVFGEYGEVKALEGIIIDMTERKKQEEHIEYLNNHDFLTGLYNRQFFDLEKERLDIKENMPLTFVVCDINGVPLINDAFGQVHGDRVIIETSRFLKEFCDNRDVLARTGGNEFSILMPNTSGERAHDIVQRMNSALEQINRIPRDPAFDLSLAIGHGTKKTTAESLPDVIKEATDYMYSRKLLIQSSSHSSILSAVVATMYERSQETEAHALRLSEISKRIAAKLSLPQKDIDELEVFAMLHDIGKVGIEDRILNKPDRLTDEEWTIMKRHPEIGYRIAKASPELEVVAEYILSHHERWDGKGYPRGLVGENIPLLARIIAVADSYDAMTEDRVYRKAMTEQEAVEEIVRNTGTQFDPEIVGLFLEIIAEDR